MSAEYHPLYIQNLKFLQDFWVHPVVIPPEHTARAKGRCPGRPPLDPDKREAALLLVQSGMSPTKAAQQIGLGRSTLYRELQGHARA